MLLLFVSSTFQSLANFPAEEHSPSSPSDFYGKWTPYPAQCVLCVYLHHFLSVPHRETTSCFEVLPKKWHLNLNTSPAKTKICTVPGMTYSPSVLLDLPNNYCHSDLETTPRGRVNTFRRVTWAELQVNILFRRQGTNQEHCCNHRV